jgi:restriction system protein
MFDLSDKELNEEYASGNGKIFYDRICWALSFMSMAGLIDKPKRGVYQISDLGEAQLKDLNGLHRFITGAMTQRAAKRKDFQDGEAVSASNDEQLTPQEELYSSAEQIRQSIYSDIIDTILSKSPREFEKLVVQLLQRMGYGGEVKEAGQVTPHSNDKGIDGIIKEDVLGLGRIHIQAKRYKRENTIGREEIQKFTGALLGTQSTKGVFITTSSYSKHALEYAENLNGATALVLINGETLAKYIYEYGLGMQIEHTIELKKLDSDYWDFMEDDG